MSADDDSMRPRIEFGICTDELFKNFEKVRPKELSRIPNIFSMNLYSGDKLSDKKYKTYYEIDMEQNKFVVPKHGLFGVGTIVGMMIDQDRGMINFYKDGNDLGQAFVDSRIKDMEFYPFFQI